MDRGTAAVSILYHFHRKNLEQEKTVSHIRINRSTMSDYEV